MSEDSDHVDKKAERTGNRSPLPRITGPHGAWTCRVCKFGPIDKKHKNCVSCGRDWFGNPGVIPDQEISTPRGRLFKGRKRRG